MGIQTSCGLPIIKKLHFILIMLPNKLSSPAGLIAHFGCCIFKSWLKASLVACKKNVNVICFPMDHQGVERTHSEMSMHSRIILELTKCWFMRRRESRSTRRKTSQSSVVSQQQTQSTWRQVRESNPGHIGGRRALSPLRHLCSIPAFLNSLSHNKY